MGPDGRSIYFSLALPICIERRSAGYDVMPRHATTIRCTVAYNTLFKKLIVGRLGLLTVQHRWLLTPHSDSHLGYLRKILLPPAISTHPAAASQTVVASFRSAR